MFSRLLLALCLLTATSFAASYKTYSTVKSPKNAGVLISFDYPSDWLAKEAQEEPIVQAFRVPKDASSDGMVCIVVKQSPKKIKERFAAAFQSETANTNVYPAARFVGKQFINDLPFPCIAFDYDMPTVANDEIMQSRIYILAIQDKLVRFHFQAVCGKKDDMRQKWHELMEHVIRSIREEPKAP